MVINLDAPAITVIQIGGLSFFHVVEDVAHVYIPILSMPFGRLNFRSVLWKIRGKVKILYVKPRTLVFRTLHRQRMREAVWIVMAEMKDWSVGMRGRSCCGITECVVLSIMWKSRLRTALTAQVRPYTNRNELYCEQWREISQSSMPFFVKVAFHG